MLATLPTPYRLSPNLDKSIDEILNPNTRKKAVNSITTKLKDIDFSFKESVEAHKKFDIHFKAISKQYESFKENLGYVLLDLEENSTEAEYDIADALNNLQSIKGSLQALHSKTQRTFSELRGQTLNIKNVPSPYIEENMKLVTTCEWLLKFVQANVLMQVDKFDKAFDVFSELTASSNQIIKDLSGAINKVNSEAIATLQLSDFRSYLPTVLKQYELAKVEAYTQAWLGRNFIKTTGMLTKYIEDSFAVIRKVVESKKADTNVVILPDQFFKPLFNALQQKASAELWAQSAGELLSLGNYRQALLHLEEAGNSLQKANSGDTLLQLNIAYNTVLSYFHLKQYDKSIKVAQEISQIGFKAPDRYSDILYIVAEAYKSIGKKEQATQYYERAVKHADKESIILQPDSKPIKELFLETVINDRVQLLEEMLSKFPNTIRDYHTNKSQSLFQHIKSAKMLALLLEHGVQPIDINDQIQTLIDSSLSKEDEKIIPALIKYASTHHKEKPAIDNIIVSLAGEKASISLYEKLISCGFDINIKDKFGYTPLHHAASRGQTEIVEFLLQHKVAVDTYDKISDTTPLQLAVLKNHYEAAKLLLDCGADPKISNILKHSAFHFAASNGNKKLLELLIEKNDGKANLNGTDPILHSAARGIVKSRENCWEVIKWLLDEEMVDPFAVDDEGIEARDILERADWSYAYKFNDLLEELGYYYTDTSNDRLNA
ncbi:MAG: hypothetical protein K0Q51_1537 [Rickettsiaceae bacterium]|jgi:ankyrin repeat protein|nr:hypothetical protein [Rickettsiaceae bacterium]